MIPQKLFPRTLRSASVEEQLSYLLQRRRTIEKLLQSLEAYARQKEPKPHPARSTGDSFAA